MEDLLSHERGRCGVVGGGQEKHEGNVEEARRIHGEKRIDGQREKMKIMRFRAAGGQEK